MEELYKMFVLTKDNEKIEYFDKGDDSLVIIQHENENITGFDDIWSCESLTDVLYNIDNHLRNGFKIEYFDETTYDEMVKESIDYSNDTKTILEKVKEYFSALLPQKTITEIVLNGMEKLKEENENLKQELKRMKECLQLDDTFCPRCGKKLYKSVIDGYSYQCLNCDEDFCEFETRKK